MAQMLLFPDPRPLVERLGADFFRRAPDHPGVYLMRDASDTVLYIGKAKSLRKRLASYRVANPERMRRRHLRLLHAVVRIELQECASEVSALAREAKLLRTLRPRFNRAGTWPGKPRYFTWRLAEAGIEMAVTETINTDWQFHPRPLGAGAIHLRAILVRLLWCAIHPAHGSATMPAGWLRGHFGESAIIPRRNATDADFEDSAKRLTDFFSGHSGEFLEWLRERTASQATPFELALREADLEALADFAARSLNRHG